MNMHVVRTRRAARLVAAAILVLTVAVSTMVLTKPASALATRLTIGPGLSSCPAGYVCLWALDNYTGSGYAFFNTESNYSTLPAPFNGINDYSWSFYSHGNTHDIRFYRGAHSGDSFVLCRGEAIPALPPNSDVDPPGGEPGYGWRDEITSHRFGSYC